MLAQYYYTRAMGRLASDFLAFGLRGRGSHDLRDQGGEAEDSELELHVGQRRLF